MRKITLLLIFLGLLLGVQSYAQIPIVLEESNFSTKTGAFKDARDGKYYYYKKYGDKDWFMHNLNYEQPEGDAIISWEGPGDPDGKAYGRFYKPSNLDLVCPTGWTSALNEDWVALTQAAATEYELIEPHVTAANKMTGALYQQRNFMVYMRGGGMVADGGLWEDGTSEGTTSAHATGAYDPVKSNETQFNFLPAGHFTGAGYQLENGIGFRAYFLGSPNRSGKRDRYENHRSGTNVASSTANNRSTLKHAESASYNIYGNIRCVRPTEIMKDQVIIADEIEPKGSTDGEFDLVARTTSGLTMTYASSDPSVATVDVDGKVTIVGAGETTITITQIGDAEFNPAPEETRVLTVSLVTTPITFSSITFENKEYDGTTSAVLEAISALEGVAVGDDVQLDYSNLVAIFADANAGDNKAITITTADITLTGADAGKYSLVLPDLTVFTANITKAPLTITARNQTMKFGTDPSILNIANAYDIAGFKNSETEAVLVGVISVSIDASITSATVAAVYPNMIHVSGGTSDNYDITYVLGSLTVTEDVGTGYITFDEVAAKTYGNPSFNLSGSHTLGKTLYFESSDPTIVSVSNESGTYVATIHKVGTVTLSAKFDGDGEAGAESVTQELVVSKATLTVKANNITRKFGEANPDASNAYTYLGFVKTSDDADFVSNPTGSIDPIYDVNTNAGNYIDGVLVSGGEHPNYNLVYEKGTLIISQTVGVIETNIPSSVTYGNPAFNLVGTHTGGNTVLYKSEDPSIVSVALEGGVWKATILGAGNVNIIAYTDATVNHESSEVTKLVSVAKAALVIKPNNHTRYYGEANPVLTLLFSGLQYSDTEADLGTVSVSTTANETSAPANYPIVATGAVNSNYDISYNEGTLTVNKAQPTLSVTDNQTTAYIGSSVIVDPATLSGVVGGALPITYEYTKDGITTAQALAAGIYTVVAKVAGDDNHEPVTSLPVTFTVTKADVVITLTGKSVNYDGSAIAIDNPVISGGTAIADLTFTTTYVGVDGTTYPETQQAPTETGKYQVTVSTAGDDNHNAKTSTASLTINVGDAILSLTGKTFTYDGTAKTLVATSTPAGLSITYSYKGTLTDGTLYAETANAPTDAGVYTVVASFAGDANHKPISATADLTIDKKASAITMIGKSATYTGQPIAIDAPVVDPAHGVATVTYALVTRRAPRTNTIAPTNVGTYKVTASYAGDNNHLSQTATAELKITPLGVPTLSMPKTEVVYNGQAQAASSAQIETALAQHLSITYTYANANYPASITAPTNAGVYTVTATTGTDVNFPTEGEITAELVIQKADQVITFDQAQLEGLTIGDAPIQLVATSTTDLPIVLASGNNSIVTIESNTLSIIKVGTVTITASQAGNENYNEAAAITHTITISSVKPVITLVDNQAGVSYTGEKILIEPATISGVVGGAQLGITYEYTKDGVTTDHALGAGTYTVVAKVVGDENHASATSYPVTFTVAQADVVIALTSKGADYQGEAIMIDAPTISGGTAIADLAFTTTYVGVDGTTYPETAQAPTNAGKYLVTVSTAGDDNHNAKSNTTSLTIKQGSATIGLSDASFVYDGTAKQLIATIHPSTLPMTYTYEGVLANGDAYQATAIAPINAGQYTVVASFAGDMNYEPTSATAQLTIGKKAATIGMVNKSVKYTGNPVSIDTPTTDPAGLELVITYTKMTRVQPLASTTSPTEVGEYAVKAEFIGSNNYLPATANAVLVVTSSPVPTLIMENKTVVYNGSKQAINPATITMNDAKHLGITYTYKNASYPATSTAPTNAGVYSVIATTATDADFPIAGEITATLTINKADQVITFDQKQLDGKTLESANFALVATNSASGLPITFVTGNSQIAEIVGNTVSIKKAGVVTITAVQHGNENYNPAANVVRMLLIKGTEVEEGIAELDYLLIDGKRVEVIDNHHRYVVPQDYTAAMLSLKAELTRNGEVLNLPTSIDVSKPSVQKIEFSVKSKNGTSTKTYVLEIEKRFDFDALVVTRWNNTLTVINNPSKHGYKFIAFQWYKDGEPIQGATLQSYTMGKNGELLSDVSTYHVEVKDQATGNVLRCWPTTLTLNSLVVVAYPNPVKQAQLLTINANVDDALLKDAKIMIYTITGQLVKTQAVTAKQTQVEMPAAVGTYVVKLVGSNGFVRDFKIIVN